MRGHGYYYTWPAAPVSDRVRSLELRTTTTQRASERARAQPNPAPQGDRRDWQGEGLGRGDPLWPLEFIKAKGYYGGLAAVSE
jgi:hypothetical protein